MKITILSITLSFSILFAQGITNTIGGNTENDKFIVENEKLEPIMVINGIKNVGIGNTEPVTPLSVFLRETAGGNEGNVAGHFLSNVSGSEWGTGVVAYALPDGNRGIGVIGRSSWIGVEGYASTFGNADGSPNTGPDRFGVSGEARYGSLTNRGVEGRGYGGTYSYGGRFESHEGSSHSFGVWALAMEAPHTAGIYGVSRNTNSHNWGMGTYGEATGPNNVNYGVFGYADGATSGNYAGYFKGNLATTGTLSKAAGSFKIDHPLDPQNKYLSHSFVESPDMMNIYNGNVTLNYAGEAEVELPSYFNSLNSDYRYQLTAIGAPGPNLYVSQEINGNSFSIAGGEPGMKVSWLITGIRQDAYAVANRIKVEENKTSDEMGKYLHPKVFGLPKSAGIAKDMLPPDFEEKTKSHVGRYQNNISSLNK